MQPPASDRVSRCRYGCRPVADELIASVVVPTYNRADRARRVLDALGRQTVPPDRFEVIVVDNHSRDDTSAVLHGLVGEVPFTLRPLRTPYNNGPALARNMGWRAARAPFVAFTDDDCQPDPAWLEAGVQRLAADPSLGVLQGCTQMPPDTEFASHGATVVYRAVDGPTPHFEGCNVFYRREALEATGGFDEQLGWYGEDAVAGWRVVDAGWDRGYEPGAVVFHDVEARGWWWHVRNNYLERNLVYVARAHPRFRRECFWRPWAMHREDAAMVAGAVALLGATWWRPLALGALPYLWLRRPGRRLESLPVVARLLVFDAARCAGHLVGSARHRVVVL